MTDKEKIAKAIELLKSVSKETKERVVFESYYHSYFMNDIISNLENTFIKEQAPIDYGY